MGRTTQCEVVRGAGGYLQHEQVNEYKCGSEDDTVERDGAPVHADDDQQDDGGEEAVHKMWLGLHVRMPLLVQREGHEARDNVPVVLQQMREDVQMGRDFGAIVRRDGCT